MIVNITAGRCRGMQIDVPLIIKVCQQRRQAPETFPSRLQGLLQHGPSVLKHADVRICASCISRFGRIPKYEFLRKRLIYQMSCALKSLNVKENVDPLYFHHWKQRRSFTASYLLFSLQLVHREPFQLFTIYRGFYLLYAFRKKSKGTLCHASASDRSD